jgi:hypothetical protein
MTSDKSGETSITDYTTFYDNFASFFSRSAGVPSWTCLKTLESQFSHEPKRTFFIPADVLKDDSFNRVLGNLTGDIKISAGAQ